MTTVIVETAVKLVVPIILVTALALLLQGHNLPGGGFIAAVLTATAFVLLYVVVGLDGITELLGLRDENASLGHAPLRWYRMTLAIGFALAVGAGLAPLAFGEPFLTQTFVVYHDVPIYVELEVASALAFDLGVYLTVVGALLTALAVVGTE